MERWKQIDGYDYEVSDQGNVRNMRTGKILKPKKHGGYLRVGLYKNGKEKNCFIHRLVAETFIPNPENKATVNHINEIKTDNRVVNLEWATMNEQVHHGTYRERKAKKRGRKVYCMELNQTFDSIKEAEEITGVKHSNIIQACQGKREAAGKMHWKYVD